MDNENSYDRLVLLIQCRRDRCGIAAASVILVVALVHATCNVIAAFVCEDSVFSITGCAGGPREDPMSAS